MICPPLEIPNSVASALDEGKLVIFAGAGVSMGPPARVPGFAELSGRIAAKLGMPPPMSGEPIDRWLARANARYPATHEICRSLLCEYKTPNEIHELILRLFRKPSVVRIVTTNFDPLFSIAAAKIWDEPVMTFNSPVLPLGDDFCGIVHLHGAIEDPLAERLVLTAEDFGRAYLSRGWARQFLQDLYSRYTVLFIGYRHADFPLEYLAFGSRSVSGNTRFAIDHRDLGRWSDYGIQVIPYLKKDAPRDHENLDAGLRSWVAEIERTPIGIEERVEQILNATVSPSPDQEDFLSRCLSSPTNAFHFVKYAQGTRLRWINWLDSKGELGKWLGISTGDEAFRVVVARWIGIEIANGQGGVGLSFVERHGGHIGNVIWEAIAYQIARADMNLGSSKDGAAWLAFLLSEYSAVGNSAVLNEVLRAASKNKSWTTVILLLETLICPDVKLVDERAPAPQQRAEVEVKLKGDMDQFLLSWNESIRPVLPEIADDLLEILNAKIDEAHRIAVLAGEADTFLDPVLISRQQIEFDPHGVFSRGMDLLLYLFTATLQSIELTKNGAMAGIAGRFLNSKNPIIIRFGLFLLRQSKDLSAAEKFGWLTDRNLFYPNAYGGTRETYDLLREIYDDLTAPQQEILWAKLEGVLPDSTDESVEGKLRAQAIDRVIWHLLKLHPADAKTSAVRERLRLRNPTLFEYEPWLPGEFMRSIPGSADKSPITVPELLSKPPAEQVAVIVGFKGKSFPDPTRDGLLDALAIAAKSDPAWAGKLMRALADKCEWDTDVWKHLFYAIRCSDLSKEDQDWFFGSPFSALINSTPNASALARFIFHGQTVEELRAMGEPEVKIRLEMSVRFAVAARGSVKQEALDYQDTKWVDIALNRAPGWITEFWLLNQQVINERAGDLVTDWPPVLAPALDLVLSEETFSDLLVVALLARHLSFIRKTAPRWTVDRFYRSLDFKKMGDKAWVTWTSLILFRSWTREIAFELKDTVRESFPQLSKAKEQVSRKFVTQTAAIAASGIFDVLAQGWLDALVRELTPEQHSMWIYALAREANSFTVEGRRQMWSAWVHKYWSDRVNVGFPPITPDEIEAYLALAIAFKEEFPTAAALLIKLPRKSNTPFLPQELLKNDLPEEQPESFLDVLLWALNGQGMPLSYPDEFNHLCKRFPRKSSLLPRWISFCERLSSLHAGDPRRLKLEGQNWFTE